MIGKEEERIYIEKKRTVIYVRKNDTTIYDSIKFEAEVYINKKNPEQHFCAQDSK